MLLLSARHAVPDSGYPRAGNRDVRRFLRLCSKGASCCSLPPSGQHGLCYPILQSRRGGNRPTNAILLTTDTYFLMPVIIAAAARLSALWRLLTAVCHASI